MAIFQRIHKDVLHAQFTHYGLFAGFVPVYVGDPEGECRVAVRNWWPEWLLDFANALHGLYVMLSGRDAPFMIKLTGAIQQSQENGNG